MKKWIIILNLLYYITFLNHWNFVESQPAKSNPTTPNSSGSSSTATNPTPVTTTVTPVSLDINKSKDTDQLDYKKDGEFRTFTPKSGYLFNKIVKKSNDIWTAKPEDHALKVVLMGSGKGPKHLAILLQNYSFVLLRKPGKNKPWTDITSDRHDVTKLKFLGEGDTELSKTSHFEVTFVDLSYKFTFKDGVKCKKIMLEEDEVWKHSDYTNFSEIKSLSLDLPTNKFIVKNSSDQSKKIEKKFKTDAGTEATPIALDIDKTESTDEFEYADENGIFTYKPNDGYVFNKVSEGTKDIWESKDNIYGILVRTMTKTSFLSKTGVSGTFAILLDNNTFKFFIQADKKWKDATTSRHDIAKLKLLGEGDNDTELSKTDYKIDLVKLSYTYIFNDGVSCKKVKLEDDEVWNHSDDTDYSDIKSFSLDLLTNTFSVKNQSDQTKELDFKPTGTTASQTQSATPATTPTQGTPTTPSSGTSGGTQPPRAGSTPASQSQSQQSQSSTHSARNGTQSQSVKTASGASSGTQPPEASGTGTPASPSQSSTPASQPTTPSSGTDTPASSTPTTP